MLLILTAALAQSHCESPTDNALLEATLDEALASYADLDEDHFRVKLLEASASVHCLSEPVRRDVAATLHRLNGLDAFSHRDLPLAERHFAAARAADPAFHFPTALIPTQSPIRERYKALKLADIEFSQLPPPAKGSVLLDGKLGLGWRHNLPAVFQRTDASGSIVQNVVLAPDAEPPVYPVLETKKPKGPREAKNKRGGARVPLLISAATGLAASGALYGAAWASGTRVRQDQPMTEQRGKAIQGVTNGLTLGSAGLLVVGAGLGVGAAFTGGF